MDATTIAPGRARGPIGPIGAEIGLNRTKNETKGAA